MIKLFEFTKDKKRSHIYSNLNPLTVRTIQINNSLLLLA